MGMTKEQLLEAAEELKEKIWYFLEIKNADDPQLREKMNDLLDQLDMVKP